MRATRTLLTIIVALLLVGGSALALPLVTEAQELAQTYAGTWAGTTSQGQPMSFTVVGSNVTVIEATFRIGGCTITSTTTTSIPIVGSSFSASTFDQGITGTFSSDTQASGTGFFTSGNPLCSGTVTVSWSATRPPQSTSISGTVRSAGGGPIAGAQIIAFPSAQGQSTVIGQSDANGAYSLNVPAGSYMVQASAEGFMAAQLTVSVPPSRADADFALTPLDVETTISGTARDMGGSPLAGVQVTASPLQAGALPVSAQTAADGTYTLSVRPGTHIVQATRADYLPGASLTVSVPPARAGADFTLSPIPQQLSIAGTVRDSRGAPIAGAQVTATPTQAGQSPVSALSGADGSYALAVGTGSYSVQATKAGYSSGQALSVTVPPSRANADLTLSAQTTPPPRTKIYLPAVALFRPQSAPPGRLISNITLGTRTEDVGGKCRVADPVAAPVSLPSGTRTFAFQFSVKIPEAQTYDVSISPGIGGGGLRSSSCDNFTVINGSVYQTEVGAVVERLDGAPIPAGDYKLLIEVNSERLEVPFTVK